MYRYIQEFTKKNGAQGGSQMIEAFYNLRLKKGKGVWGFWEHEASCGKMRGGNVW